MARNTYGLDLGSYEIKVYDKKQDTIWKEKNVLAVQDKKRHSFYLKLLLDSLPMMLLFKRSVLCTGLLAF